MNPVTCSQALEGVGSGVAASLRAVDCAASATAQAAFGRLFGSADNGGGALLPVLTILLTLYVAFFAFSLITGRSALRISALTPRMITLGLVLTFATSWIAYQGVVWNLAVGAPDQIAGVLMGSPAGDKGGPATQIFADKIDVILSALVDATGQQAAEAGAASTFSPPGLMWLGGTLLLLGTVGVLATCKIALAVLLALGPVFVVMALFPATRGLFTGWLKGVVLLAIAPLFAVLGGSLMLELSVPVVRTLTSTPGQIDARAAMAFFMIGTVHVALMIMVLKVAATMVAGWRVFGLVAERAGEAPARAATLAAAAAAPAAAAVAAAAGGAAGAAGSAPSRQIRLAATLPPAANDPGSLPATARPGTRLVAGPAAAPVAAANSSLSRARGIGSRFRAPQSASMEKFR